jgi:hypothetical protein
MAELAHDASGPASSEPAGIALQSGPASSDKGKLRVFISYSRDDLDFADQLAAALDFSGFECFIDREGISGGEAWKRRLGNLISEADTVVFVLSPSSARSEICDWEVEEATRLNKRILPVICRPLEGVSPPPRLQDLNYIFFYKEPKVPGSGFGTGLASLITALNTDFDWLREHTRYLQRAIEWDKGGRPANRLLSGNDIVDAKAWVARRPKGAPEPTALQLDFIRASEEEAEARLSEQRKQLEAMAAAQAERETALHDREEALKQRARVARVRNIALVAVSILAVLGGLLAWVANQQRITAEENRQIAEQALQGVKEIGAGSTRTIEGFTDKFEKLFEMLQADYARRYAEALRLIEALAAKVELVETARDGKPGKETAEALATVARFALIAKEFTKALTVADRSHAFFPDDLGIETNRAHALMFMERGEEAKALYLTHKGKPLSVQDNRLWERVIVEDFGEFRKVDLTHPMMADIEKELGVSR